MKKIIAKLLALLHIRSSAAGLEISDRVIRLVAFDGKVWQMHALRLEAGVLDGGRIKDRAAFVAALTALKAKLGKQAASRRMNVVLCMSSVPAYTQVFPLPMVQGQNLQEAVSLNLQMASPMEEGEAYSGWQQVGRDDKTLRIEILAAFIERKIVDEMVDALFEAGFIVMAVESRALALTRVLREKGAGVDPSRAYLFVNIDNSGVDFLIIRNGSLYFEYTNAWKDLMDDKGDIPIAKFESTFATSLRQVMNFYNQHWPDPLAAVILSAVALEAQAEKVIAAVAPLPAAKLTLVMGQPVSSEWLTALGCSLRTTEEINLLGGDSRDRFHEEQLLLFLRFWRAIVPGALSLLVITFFVADAFLSSTKTAIESRSDFVSLNGAQTTETSALQASAVQFNAAIGELGQIERSLKPKNKLIGKIVDLAAAKQVVVNHVAFQGFTVPITFSGTAQSQDHVVALKAALQADPSFSGVNLPLTGVQTNGNQVVFSMSFVYTP